MQTADPITIAYIAIGVAAALKELDASPDGGELEFVSDIIGWASMLDGQAELAGDALTGCHAYEVAQPFGYQVATLNLDGKISDENVCALARRLTLKACSEGDAT